MIDRCFGIPPQNRPGAGNPISVIHPAQIVSLDLKHKLWPVNSLTIGILLLTMGGVNWPYPPKSDLTQGFSWLSLDLSNASGNVLQRIY
ncbi:hypothetical protein A3197_05935 [Candidatus Thiodiazotropha endoloripes]|nr:hypothetical protein A3197_05935 [Candidatus Thiodiazotropha endoloripes]